MSIKDFVQKIKRYLDIDTYIVMCLLIIVIVGISSFGLGRLSVNTNTNKDLGVYIVNKVDKYKNTEIKKYVASKNGSLYYRIGCKSVNRISMKNRIYFGNFIEAEKSGYKPSTSC